MKYMEGMSCISTQDIPSAYSTDSIRLHIPISIAVDQVKDIIANLEEELRKMGVKNEEGD